MAITKVKIMNTTHVKPKNPLGKKQCNLTTFDLPYLAFYYNQKLLLYKTESNVVFDEDVVEKLKDGLRLVLEDFYQLAGKLAKDDAGVFRVEYDADDGEIDGVEFSVAAADDVSVDDLTGEDGTVTLKELVPYNGILNVEGLRRPLLAVQVTKLKDGLAMGLAFNHAVLDGTSTWHFISSWAELCHGAHSISAQPFLDRSKARNVRVNLHLSLPNGDSAAAAQPPLREKVFRFSESAVDTVKSRTNASGSDSKPFSTFQSLSAHIWRHVTLARGLNPGDVTVFTVFADCRRRVDPPMPDEYFGNLIQAIFTGTAAGLLATEGGPAIGATVIQKAIAAHDARAIQARNEEWEKSPKIFQWKDAGANCVAVGSSPRFRVYDVDFGWGKPEFVRSGSNNRFDGMVYLYQGKSGGRSIDVEISLEASVMEKLEKDADFHLKMTEEGKTVNGIA
ncbi:PREDICTED: BAHD acyltransferase DCR [Tarenaya hassleriana]|uniref:BAHD acyltransferase DCR n=1 Tax=Tarenaya hassleriana TaxID=28532 RepID=UPI00053C6CAA|nr:PREDICTED: BAHD acyltransferase DCR [Tarenaya hassleriana]